MPPDPGLGVAAVARRLGVAPSTLRSWERRYGLGPSLRTAGSHRRYTADDVAVLDRMRRLTLEGVAPADAARVALHDPAPFPTAAPEPEFRVPLAVVPVRRDAARGLTRAAAALDALAVRDALRASVAADGVIATWEALLGPVLAAVGERVAATGEGVEVEYLLAEAAVGVFAQVDPAVPAPCRPVLLACTGGRSLPLHVLCAALAERSVAARVLGAVPADALAAAVRRTGPAALVVYSRFAGDPAMLAGVPAQRPPTAVLAGGPGWAPEALPERVTYVPDLGEAVHLVLLATGLA